VHDRQDGEVKVIVKRRRTRRHRRNRLVRRLLAAVALCAFSACVSAIALMYFSPSLFRPGHPASAYQSPERSSERAATVDRVLSQVQPARPVYPYSVVPGGVEDVQELKWVAEHDPIVGAHYAGFNYAHAQVVRLTLARTVYISYRIGNRIYWTSHRVTLHKGEKLITDGRITARTRCANRVEEAPQQQAASPVEPAPEKFDQPVGNGEGTAMVAPPPAFQSALLNRSLVPGLGPAGPLTVYDPFTSANFIPIAPPPVPVGLCAPPIKKKGTGIEMEVEADATSTKKKSTACGAGGGSLGTTPEPTTWLLFASGLAAIYWRARRRLIGA